ncbi:MAG TPA: DUF2946 family protein [Pirellulales bacterium]|nr:DUF2946 family protein [Pirellulales bacterium]
MSKQMHRWLSWAVVLGYLLASNCLGVWHSHHGGLHSCQHGASHSLGCHHNADETAMAAGDAQPRGSMPKDHCAVCRFLAQSALPVTAVAPPMLGELVVEARTAPPAAPIVWSVSGGPARAPPCDA